MQRDKKEVAEAKLSDQEVSEAILSVEEKSLRDLQQAFEQAKATQEKAGGPLSTFLNGLLPSVETWPLSYRQQLADKIEEIYQSLGWWGNSKKKQEKQEKIAKLRQQT